MDRILVVVAACAVFGTVFAADGDQLKLVQAVWRHGDRSQTVSGSRKTHFLPQSFHLCRLNSQEMRVGVPYALKSLLAILISAYDKHVVRIREATP